MTPVPPIELGLYEVLFPRCVDTKTWFMVGEFVLVIKAEAVNSPFGEQSLTTFIRQNGDHLVATYQIGLFKNDMKKL